MMVRYELETGGRVIRELTGEVHNNADMDTLRKAFWAELQLKPRVKLTMEETNFCTARFLLGLPRLAPGNQRSRQQPAAKFNTRGSRSIRKRSANFSEI